MCHTLGKTGHQVSGVIYAGIVSMDVARLCQTGRWPGRWFRVSTTLMWRSATTMPKRNCFRFMVQHADKALEEPQILKARFERVKTWPFFDNNNGNWEDII